MRRIIDVALLLVFALALILLPSSPPWRSAQAGVSCSVPFNLTNGTTADASQVMANYNAILTCLSTNTAASGANNDITSLSGLTTPLSPAQGGAAYFIGGTSAGTNTITLANPSPNGFAYTAGYFVTFIAGGTNTGATTLNVNSLGAKNVFKQTSTGPAASTGGEIVIGQLTIAYYDGTQFEVFPANITPVGIGSINFTNPPYGIEAPINLQINATTGANALTVAVKSAALNNDPTAVSPVLVPFKNPTGASSNTSAGPNGNPVWLSITGALSIVVPSTQTLGTANGLPFRFWVVAINNSGTVELALINCIVGGATPTQVFPLAEHNLISTTAIAAAPSAGVFYSAALRTSVPFRIIGYVEFGVGLATAGTYTGSPTNVQLFGPGIKKPGDVVQSVYATTTTPTNVNSTVRVATSLAPTITPTSTVNLIRAQSYGTIQTTNATANQAAFTQIYRSTTATGIGNFASAGGVASTSHWDSVTANFALDQPATVSSTTYGVYIVDAAGTANWIFLGTNDSLGTNTGVLMLDEIMGALEPANDNFAPLSAVG